MCDTPKTDKEAMWATSGTGEDFRCIHIDEAREMETHLRKCLKELAGWYDDSTGKDPNNIDEYRSAMEYLNS